MAKKPTSEKKLYRNAGVTTLVIEGQDMEPDSQFEASLDPAYEMQMLQGGHLEILRDQSAKADEAQAEAAGETTENETSRERPSRRNR
jgi:hypothetical protein